MISLLYKELSRFSETDQKKITEYMDSNKQLCNAYIAVESFRKILTAEDENALEAWMETIES